jgi:hypothetical protein
LNSSALKSATPHPNPPRGAGREKTPNPPRGAGREKTPKPPRGVGREKTPKRIKKRVVKKADGRYLIFYEKP